MDETRLYRKTFSPSCDKNKGKLTFSISSYIVHSVDWALDRGWTRHISIMTELGKEIPQNYYADYKAEMIAMHGDSFYWGWFYILFPLFWFCLLISPNWRCAYITES
jgi:hypothetical protein